MTLRISPFRTHLPGTDIFVRALDGKKWVAADISKLNTESLLEFLRSRGGHNPWAENVVGILLGHGNLVEEEQP